jgi:mannose-6-phosphate isomerase
MKLATRIVEKPWGRSNLPSSFSNTGNRPIGEIWFEHPDGDVAPLMIKYLFTSERLSIQVHPDDKQARAAGFPRGKEECWLIIGAEPGAELGVGLTNQITLEDLRAAAGDGSIEQLIDWRPAKVGDFIYNAAGTIHAIGAGLTLIEVQQNVDCTYRLYDYGRPRELHLDEGLAVAFTAPRSDERDRNIGDEDGNITLVDGPKFSLVRAVGPLGNVRWADRELTVVPLSDSCVVDGETVVVGECAIASGGSGVALEPKVEALIAWVA